MHVQQLADYTGKELPVLAILTNGRHVFHLFQLWAAAVRARQTIFSITCNHQLLFLISALVIRAGRAMNSQPAEIPVRKL
jgi:hypothetical protein